MAGDETSSLGVSPSTRSDTHFTGSTQQHLPRRTGPQPRGERDKRLPRPQHRGHLGLRRASRGHGDSQPRPCPGAHRHVRGRRQVLGREAFRHGLRLLQPHLRHARARRPGPTRGCPSSTRTTMARQDTGEPNVLQRQNTGQATVQGVELEARYRPTPDWQLFGNFTATTGDDDVADQPLARIPPKFGTVGVRWTSRLTARPWAEVVFHFASAQRRLNPADVSDTRIGASGTDGFGVVTLRAGATLPQSRIRGTPHPREPDRREVQDPRVRALSDPGDNWFSLWRRGSRPCHAMTLARKAMRNGRRWPRSCTIPHPSSWRIAAPGLLAQDASVPHRDPSVQRRQRRSAKEDASRLFLKKVPDLEGRHEGAPRRPRRGLEDPGCLLQGDPRQTGAFGEGLLAQPGVQRPPRPSARGRRPTPMS